MNITDIITGWLVDSVITLIIKAIIDACSSQSPIKIAQAGISAQNKCD